MLVKILINMRHIGIGQVSNSAVSEIDSLEYTISQAQQAGNLKDVDQLELLRDSIKEFVVFEHSAHYPQFEEETFFADWLIKTWKKFGVLVSYHSF